jgi:hypothetical protein
MMLDYLLREAIQIANDFGLLDNLTSINKLII